MAAHHRITFIVAIVTIGFLSFLAGRATTRNTVKQVQSFVFESSLQSQDFPAPECVDPYKLPGYLYIPEDYRQSVYIPFYRLYHDYKEPSYAAYPWVQSSSPDLSDPIPEKELLTVAPHSWMRDLVAYSKLVDDAAYGGRPVDRTRLKQLEASLSWLRDKRVLMIADSVDRYMMAYLCEEVGYEAIIDTPRHTTASCEIPFLNFTINHWHLASYYTYRPKWWWQDIMEYVAFEDRYEHLFKSKVPEIIGKNGLSPDLILFQSGLWDQVTFNKKYSSEPEGKYSANNEKNSKITRQSTWAELRFYSVRLRKFIGHLRDVFGEDAHILHRSLTPHKTFDDRDIMVLEMDRAARSVAQHENIETFDWARLITGFSSSWKDDVHVNKGALSWLYQNIMLSYLFRASGGVEHLGKIIREPPDVGDGSDDPWMECHDWQVFKNLDNR